jgi:hypothetical protein
LTNIIPLIFRSFAIESCLPEISRDADTMHKTGSITLVAVRLPRSPDCLKDIQACISLTSAPSPCVRHIPNTNYAAALPLSAAARATGVAIERSEVNELR